MDGTNTPSVDVGEVSACTLIPEKFSNVVRSQNGQTPKQFNPEPCKPHFYSFAGSSLYDNGLDLTGFEALAWDGSDYGGDASRFNLEVQWGDGTSGTAYAADAFYSIVIETETTQMELLSADATFTASIGGGGYKSEWEWANTVTGYDCDDETPEAGEDDYTTCWLGGERYTVTFKAEPTATIDQTGNAQFNSVGFDGSGAVTDVALCSWDASLVVDFCVGATFADAGVGVPQITHNFGTTDYVCTCTIEGGSSSRYVCGINTTSPPTANVVTLDIWDGASTRGDRPGHAMCFAGQ